MMGACQELEATLDGSDMAVGPHGKAGQIEGAGGLGWGKEGSPDPLLTLLASARRWFGMEGGVHYGLGVSLLEYSPCFPMPGRVWPLVVCL